MTSPLLIAHRGAHASHPQNSLAAIEAALLLGADGIEIDVHMTADGSVVVHHDAVLRPSGEDEEEQVIALLTLLQLSSFPLGDGSRIPTLDQALEICAGRTTVFVEIKAPEMESAVTGVILRSGCDAAVHSFDHRIVRRCADEAPSIRRGILLHSYMVDHVRVLEETGATDLWQYHEYIDTDLVDEVHSAGGRVIAWTVNDSLDAAALAAIGVDGLCTDDLRPMRRAIHAL